MARKEYGSRMRQETTAGDCRSLSLASPSRAVMMSATRAGLRVERKRPTSDVTVTRPREGTNEG